MGLADFLAHKAALPLLYSWLGKSECELNPLGFRQPFPLGCVMLYLSCSDALVEHLRLSPSLADNI